MYGSKINRFTVYSYWPMPLARHYEWLASFSNRFDAYRYANSVACVVPSLAGWGITIVPEGTDFDEGIHYDGAATI